MKEHEGFRNLLVTVSVAVGVRWVTDARRVCSSSPLSYEPHPAVRARHCAWVAERTVPTSEGVDTDVAFCPVGGDSGTTGLTGF